MSESILRQAIGSKNRVQFYYTGAAAPGVRVVEPHMIAYNRKNNLALSGWYLSGASESGSGEGWREYLISEITSVVILPTQFSSPRPGYRPDGGKTFHNVQCAL
jgi:predicted DNA-binding transcriptional regulator YafY